MSSVFANTGNKSLALDVWWHEKVNMTIGNDILYSEQCVPWTVPNLAC